MIKVRDSFLPFSVPDIGEEEILEVIDTIKSGWLTTGPKVAQFEQEFKEYVKASHAIAVNSCTAGLHISLAAIGVKPGDEVIVPTLTFVSTANVVVHLGAIPILVDVKDDFNINPFEIEKSITSRTKAIIPVHYGGQSCDLDAIYDIARNYGLSVIEDAAHAVGATYRNYKIGSDELFSYRDQNIKRTVVFSFYATKNITTGEGGMIVTNDDNLAEKLRLLSLHGMSKDAWKRYSNLGNWYYEVTLAGYKYNLPDILAAIGIHQLRKIERFISIRQAYARIYDEFFSNIPEIEIPVRYTDRNHVFHLYVIRLSFDRLKISREKFIEELKRYNIGASVHFIPVHLHPFYQNTYGYKLGDFPNAEKIYNSIISLPLYPKMSESDVKYVAEVVKNLVEKNRK